MDYEKKYKDMLDRAKTFVKRWNSIGADNSELVIKEVKEIFPELKESNDEKIRKELKALITWAKSYSASGVTMEDAEMMLAWLEKIGEHLKFCKTIQIGDRVTRNKYGVLVNMSQLDRIAKPRKNKNEQKQEWSEEDENEYNHILKILNLVAEEQEIKGYNNLISSVNWFKSLKDRIQPRQSNKTQGKTALEAIKEEKVDNANKVEPKFKVGDWVVRKNGGFFDNETKFAQITEIDGEKHWFDTGLICLKAEDMRLWTLEDAKDGDILISWTNKPFIYNGFFNETYVGAYCGLNTFNRIIIADTQGYLHHNWTINKDVRPATKEQRDLLFAKMGEKGYKWVNEKKELIRRI